MNADVRRENGSPEILLARARARGGHLARRRAAGTLRAHCALGTAFAHLSELAQKRSMFEAVGGDKSQHFIPTMLCGLLYWKPSEDQRDAR